MQALRTRLPLTQGQAVEEIDQGVRIVARSDAGHFRGTLGIGVEAKQSCRANPSRLQSSGPDSALGLPP